MDFFGGWDSLSHLRCPDNCNSNFCEKSKLNCIQQFVFTHESNTLKLSDFNTSRRHKKNKYIVTKIGSPLYVEIT